MNKIYMVAHYYVGGEISDFCEEFEDRKYYSTFENASSAFWEAVYNDYEGRFTLTEIVLDSNESTLLEESAYISCSSKYVCDYEEDYEDYEMFSDDTCDDEEYTYYNTCDEEELYYEEEAIDEWLTHKGYNYEIFEEIENDRLAALLEEHLKE